MSAGNKSRPTLEGAIKVGQTDMRVLTDYEDLEHPIAIHGASWWMSKTDVADLITALTKALQEAP